MRFSATSLLSLLAIAALLSVDHVVVAKKPSRPSGASRPPRSSSGRKRSGGSSSRAPPPVSRRRPPQPQYEEEEEEEDYFDQEDDVDEEEEEEIDDYPPPRPKRRPTGSSSRPSSKSARKPPPRRRRPVDDYDEEDYYEPRRPQPRGSRGRGPPDRRGGRGGRRDVVSYRDPPQPAFTRGLAALKQNLPDPSTLKNAAVSSLSAARQTTSRLSSNIYRDIKGLTSSELEQVMLKATRPDDTPVKGKHVERLVGVTYQISGRYDIYDAVLRKLWSKMAEKDWRTTIKALYVLHRFSSDGAPEHQAALKARLRELRRTRDPKRKDKFFNSKQLLAGGTTVSTLKRHGGDVREHTLTTNTFILLPFQISLKT